MKIKELLKFHKKQQLKSVLKLKVSHACKSVFLPNNFVNFW